MSVTGMDFGIYDPLRSTPTLTTSGLVITCNLLSGPAINVPLRIDLSAGSSGSFATRQLRSGSYLLNYNLYPSAAFTQIWGDGTGGTFFGSGSVLLNPGQPSRTLGATLYGRIAAGQDPGPGNYADTIIITVTY
jgi:spore coat protein U-like protein